MGKFRIKESFNTIHKAFGLLGKYKKVYLLGLFLSCAKYAITFINPALYKFITSIVLGSMKESDYLNLIGMFLLFIFLIPVFCYGSYLKAKTCIKVQGYNQKCIFSHIIKMPLQDIESESSGVYLTKITNDIIFINRLFKDYTFTSLIKFIIFSIVASVLLIRLSLILFLVCFFVGLIFLIINLLLIPYIRKLEISAKNSTTKLHSYVIDFLNSIVMIRVFSIENFLLNKFSLESDNISKNKSVSKSIVGIFNKLIDIFKIIVQPISIILIIKFLPQSLSLPDIIFASGVIAIAAEGLCNLIIFFQNIQADIICINRIYSILNSSLEEDKRPLLEGKNLDREKPTYAIEIKNLSFAYKGHSNIFNNFNLKVKENQFMAIVGESGCGKSTILKLLQRLYEIKSGEILLFGKTLPEYSLAELRDKFAYVSQENLLFNDTIKNNVKFINKEVSEEDYQDAIKIACLTNLVNDIDNKDEKIGENGCMLSGGEKQRIAIARAILKGSDILLLDEFTSALDKNTEKLIYENLQRYIGKKTIIMVTHRLDYIERADCIAVVDGGEIIEMGTHHELLNKNGRYKELYEYKY